MKDVQSRFDLELDPVMTERLKLWMATHSVSCQEEAIHRLLSYALDSAGIERKPKVA